MDFETLNNFLYMHLIAVLLMDSLNDLQILELSKSLTSKEAAREILANFLPLVSSQVNVQ